MFDKFMNYLITRFGWTWAIIIFSALGALAIPVGVFAIYALGKVVFSLMQWIAGTFGIIPLAVIIIVLLGFFAILTVMYDRYKHRRYK